MEAYDWEVERAVSTSQQLQLVVAIGSLDAEEDDSSSLERDGRAFRMVWRGKCYVSGVE